MPAMSKILRNPLTLALMLLSLAAWAYFPRLVFFVSRALASGIHVPGENLYWLPLILPPMVWLILWYCQFQDSRFANRLMLSLACLLTLVCLAVTGGLLWQYCRAGVPLTDPPPSACEPLAHAFYL